MALRRNDAKAASEILKQAEKQAGDSVDLRQAWAWYLSNTRGSDGAKEQSEALVALVRDLDTFPPEGRARLLEEEKVAAVPGIAFGADEYIRISYATSMANIEKGLDRIEKFVQGLGK